MSAWRENAERVREALDKLDDDGACMCHDPANTAGYECDWHISQGGLNALNTLTAQMEELDARIKTLNELEKNVGELEADVGFLDDYLTAQGEMIQRIKEWQTRAEAAEQKVEELEEAARFLRSQEPDIRAAKDLYRVLAQSDPPED